MPTLRIREFKNIAAVGFGAAQVALEGDNVVDQTALAIGGETKSAAFATGTWLICITSDAIFSYAVGKNPTATTNMVRFPADTVLYLGVQPGDKLSVIANT